MTEQEKRKRKEEADALRSKYSIYSSNSTSTLPNDEKAKRKKEADELRAKYPTPSVKSSGSGASSAVNQNAQNTQTTTGRRAGITSESNTGDSRWSGSAKEDKFNRRMHTNTAPSTKTVSTEQPTTVTVSETVLKNSPSANKPKINEPVNVQKDAKDREKAQMLAGMSEKERQQAFLQDVKETSRTQTGAKSNLEIAQDKDAEKWERAKAQYRAEQMKINEGSVSTAMDEKYKNMTDEELLTEMKTLKEEKEGVLSKVKKIGEVTYSVAKKEDYKSQSTNKYETDSINTASEEMTQRYQDKFYSMSNEERMLVAQINAFDEGYSKDGGARMNAAAKLKNEYDYTNEEITAMVYFYNRYANEEKARNDAVDAELAMDEHPFLESVASVPMSLAGGVGSAIGIADSYADNKRVGKIGISDQGLDYNHGMSKWQRQAQTGRQRFTDTHDLMVGEYDIGDLLYNTALSGMESAVAAAVPGGAALLGIGAGTSRANELSQRGLSSNKSLIGGIAAATFETLGEKFTIGNIKALQEVDAKTIKDVVGNIAKSIGVNFSEEAATEVANIIYDTVAHGDKSEFEMAVQELMNTKGITRAEAENEAFKGQFWQVVEAGASGALMGFGFGGASTVPSAISRSVDAKATGKAINQSDRAVGVLEAAKVMPTDTRAYKLSQKAKADENGNISDKQIGKIAQAEADYISEQKKPDSGYFKGAQSAAELGDTYKRVKNGIENQTSITENARKKKLAELERQYTEAKKAFRGVGTANAVKRTVQKDSSYFAHREQRQIDEHTRMEVKHPELIIGDRSVNVAEIVDIEDGDIKVKTTGGEEISLSQSKARFADADVKRLYDEAAKMNKDTAKVFLESYDGDDVAEFKRAFEYYYNMGKAGTSVQTIREHDGVFGAILTADAQQRIAEAGLMDKEFKSGLTDWSVKNKKSNLYKFEKGVLQAIGEKFGTEFIILDESSDINAKYLTGTNRIVVYRNADGGVMLRSAAHETYHFVENYSSKDAADLRDYVIDSLKGNGVDIEKALEKYAKQGYATRDEQISELVADSMFDVFSNEDFIKNLTAKNQTLAKRLANHIGELVQKIRDAVKMLSVRYSNPEIKALMDDAEKLDTIRNMLLEGYKNAGENFKAEQEEGQKNNAEGTAVKSKYSFKAYSEQQLRNWENSKRIVVYKSNEQFLDFITEAINQKNNNKKLYFGAIGNELAIRIKENTGINVENFNCSLSAYEIKKILKDHGNDSKERQRGQRAVTQDDFLEIPNVILEADEIKLSEKEYNGKPAIEFKKRKDNERKTVVAVVSNDHMDLFVQTSYINIKKGNLAVPTDEQASVNTPKANNGTVSTNSIPKTIKSVKQNFSVKQTDEITKFNMQTAKENRIYRQIFNLLDDAVYTGIRIKKIPDPKFIRQQAQEMLKEVGSTYSVNELTEELTVVYEYMSQQAGKNLYKTEDFFPNVLAIARRVVDQCTEKDSSAYDDAKEIRDVIKETPIYISPELKNEIISQFGSYKTFRQLMMGRALRLTTTDTSATPLDVFWKEELTTRNQTYFPEDTVDKDMPAKILEFFDKIKPTIVNTKSDVDVEASILASEIIKRFSNNPDRMMTKKGEIYKEYMKNHLAQVKTAQKELRETLQNEAKAEYETRLVAYKTKREYTDRNRVLRNKAERDIWYLQKRIEKETDNDNIPQKFKPFVKSLLRILPTEGGAVTYNADKVNTVKTILSQMKELEETGSDFVLGDSIYDEIAVCIDNFFSKIESTNKLDKVGGNKRTAISISNLTNEELELLNKITTTSRKAIQDYQKLFKNGRNMSVEKYSLSMHRDLEAKAKPPKKLPKSKIGIEARKRTNKIKGEATKYITPAFLFERLGEKGKELFKNLRNGENVVGQMIVKGQKAFNNAWEKCNFDERWRYKHEEVKLSSGTYNISVMDLISFYCTVRQKQGLDHVLEGGMMITQVDRDIQQHIHFTEKDVEAMVNKLTPDQKLYGELMVEYMSGDVAADRNVVSMRKYGIEKYNTHNYYPLKVSSNYNKAYIGRPDGGQVISGQSSAKRRIEGAVAPLVLENFETVVTRHLYQSALYCGYVLPLDDIKAVLNYRSVDRSVPFGEEQSLIESAWLDKETSKTISIKEDIKNAVGEEMYNRLIKFLEDVDSGSMKVDESKAFAEFIVKAKKAAVMANLSVVVQQPFSFVRGTKGISPKNIVLHTNKAEIEEMKKWNGCAVIKEIGYFDAGTGRSPTEWMLEHKTKRADRKDWSFSEKLDIAWDKKGAKIDEWGGKLASKADELTWGCLWATVKKQVKNENPDLEGDALLEKAAERFQDMIAKTQVYDSVFAKSEAQRTNTTYMKLLTAFKGEPITSFNGIVGAIYDLTEAPAEEKKAKLKDVSVTVGLYVLSTVFTGAAKSLVYALRDDDDDKSFIEKFTANLVYNTVTDPIGMIPLADKVIDAFSGYTSTSMDTSFITYLGASFDKGIDMISVLGNDKSTEAEKKKAIKNFVTPVLKAMSLSSGVPADRVISDAISITNQIWDKITKKTSEPTTAEGIKQAIAEKFNASATDYEQLYEATIKGDTDHYDKVYKNLVDAGKDERNIDNGLATALSENDERIKLAYQAMESGDSATSKKYIEELTAIGFKDDVVASAINKYETRLVKELLNKDERVVKAAEAFDSGDYSTYISIKDELIDEGEYSESVIDSAIDKHLKDGESQAYENFIKDLVKKDSRIASAYNKLSSGESADEEMVSLEKDGYEEEIVYTALQRYQNELIDEAEKDPRTYEAAKARYDRDYDEYEKIVNELIAEKKYPEGVIESAVEKQLEAVVEEEAKAFEAADKDRYSKDYDLKNAIVNGNEDDVAEVYKRYVEEHGYDQAGTDVRSAIRQAYKKGHIEYDEAEELLTVYAKDGTDENDIYWDLYEVTSETGSKYDKLDEMVENGDRIDISYLTNYGVEVKTIRQRTTRKYKSKLLTTKKGSQEWQDTYDAAYSIYRATGMTGAQARKHINNWYNQ